MNTPSWLTIPNAVSVGRLLLVPLLGVLIRSLAGAKGILAVGFAAGLTALLLHALIDFNLHIPANAATGAVLAGALLGLPWNAKD